MLTDSGGFQVFSLKYAQSNDGVTFRSHIDGSEKRCSRNIHLNPGETRADIIMAFDECAKPLDHDYAKEAMHRTHV